MSSSNDELEQLRDAIKTHAKNPPDDGYVCFQIDKLAALEAFEAVRKEGKG